MRLVPTSLKICLLILLAVGGWQGQADGQVTLPDAKLELVAEGYKFTEGPAVDKDGDVYFTDQPNDRILRWSAEDDKVETWLQPAGRSNGLFFDSDGSLIACADEHSQLWSIARDKSHTVLLEGFKGKRFNGPNDVWVGADGSFYFTDPFYKRGYWSADRQEPELPKCVYRLTPGEKEPEVVAEGFKQPNGIVGDAEKGLLFIADIGDRKTYRFKIGKEGALVERELFYPMGSDGMTAGSTRKLVSDWQRRNGDQCGRREAANDRSTRGLDRQRLFWRAETRSTVYHRE